jgi:hypothetical protein
LASFAAGKLSEQLDSQLADNADALAGAEEQSQTALETTILLSSVNADRDSVYGAAVAVRQVLKGRFGINNPTWETHKISLRRELFRIGTSTNTAVEVANVSAWQNKLYTYRVPDIRQVPEFKVFCQVYSPMGTNEPAIVIPFSTEIKAGRNLFGLPLAGYRPSLANPIPIRGRERGIAG